MVCSSAIAFTLITREKMNSVVRLQTKDATSLFILYVTFC